MGFLSGFSKVGFVENYGLKYIFQYLKDLKERGARIIIGEFFDTTARTVMCEAYKLGMTQSQGYVWFLPGWYQNDWYKLDEMRAKNDGIPTKNDGIPNCTTAEMIEVNTIKYIFPAFSKIPKLLE